MFRYQQSCRQTSNMFWNPNNNNCKAFVTAVLIGQKVYKSFCFGLIVICLSVYTTVWSFINDKLSCLFPWQVNELDMQEFRKIVGHRMITDPSETEPYNIDWLRIVRYVGDTNTRPIAYYVPHLLITTSTALAEDKAR